MKIEFKPEELITKSGKAYPVVGGRLRVAHKENQQFSIKTELIHFEPAMSATVKADIKTEKGEFQAFGASSSTKDQRLSESLLELAETRAIARALRFAGYGVEYTGSEEIPTIEAITPQFKTISSQNNPASRPQLHAIEKIATIKKWDPFECCRRIL